MVERKDVVLALLGASAALDGLALVFLGLAISAYAGRNEAALPALSCGAADCVRVGVVCVVVSASWLLELGGNRAVYVAVLVLFFAQVALLAGAAAWTSEELLWD